MKKKVLKILSFLLCLVLMASSLQTILFAAGKSAPIETNVVGMSIAFQENYRNTVSYGPGWVIVVKTDQNIAYNSKNNYWLVNSQQEMVEKQASGLLEGNSMIMTVDEHNALREELKNKILINGKSLKYWHELDGNELSIRVDLTNNNGVTNFVIQPRAEYGATKENLANVNDYTDFDITFSDDLVINNCKINSSNWRYHAINKTFTKSTNNATILSQNLIEKDNKLVYSFETTEDISGGSNLNDLISKIEINGKAATNDVVITTGNSNENTEQMLYVSIPKNNSYGIADLNSRSTISFSSFTINGVNVPASKFRWSVAEKALISDNDGLHELVPTNMSYSGHAHKTTSGTHKGQFRTLWNNYCAVYAISLETDKNFDMSLLDTATGRPGVQYRSGFAGYGPHLDYAFTGYKDSDAHNAVAQKLGESISINGVTIAEAFKENVYTSMSVFVGILDNKLTIVVPVGYTGSCTSQIDNTAKKGLYVGDFCETGPATKEFILEIKEGLEIGGIKFAGAKYQYTPVNTDWVDTGKFTALSNDYKDTATITGVETVANTNSKFSSSNKGGYTVVTIDTNRKMSESAAIADGNGYYYTTRLNQKNVKYNFEKTSPYNDFQEKILLNGFPLATYMLNHAKAQEALGVPLTADWDTFLGVGTSVVKNDTHKLHISLPGTTFTSGALTVSGEKYGYDLSGGFTVTILPGLMLNGSELQAGVITVTPDGSGYKSVFEPSYDLVYYAEPTIASLKSGKLSNGKYGGNAHKSHTPESDFWILNVYYGVPLTCDASLIGCGEADAYYYNYHLQSAPALKTTVLNGISVTTDNGTKTLAECFAIEAAHSRTDDKMLNGALINAARAGDRVLHIALCDESIEIAIPKDNAFGFNGDKAFTLNIGQMSLGKTIKSSTISFDPNALGEKFTVSSQPYVEVGSEVILTQDSKGENWEIRIPSTNGKLATVIGELSSDLQFFQRQPEEINKIIGEAIINSVTINGETIADGIARTGSHYIARITTSGKELIIRLMRKTPNTYDNQYYINDKTDFTVGIKNDLSIGRAVFESNLYTYSAQTGTFSSNGSYDANKEHAQYTKSLLKVTGSDTEDNPLLGGECGIKIYSGGSYYVDFQLEARVRNETLGLKKPIHDKKDGFRWATYWVNEHGKTVRDNIILDGMSVGNWIEKGFGDIYCLMIQFDDAHIRILSNGVGESNLSPKEWHWIEFTDGLMSQCSKDENGNWINSNEYIESSKWVYSPDTLKWVELSTVAQGQYTTFEDAAKAGAIGYPEYQLKLAAARELINSEDKKDDNYTRPTIGENESAVIDKTQNNNDNDSNDSDNNNNSNNSNNNESSNTDNNSNNNNSNNATENEDKKEPTEQIVVHKEKVPGKITYVEYFPTWGVVLIVIGAIVVVGGIILLVVKKKKNN